MKTLQSYVQKQWVTGSSTPIELVNAINGEAVAQIKNGGFEPADMITHAREIGGHALRQLTFHERAIRLKQLALYLLEHKNEFYTLSAATGATHADSWMDIEGGIQTLFFLFRHWTTRITQCAPHRRW